MSFDNFATNDWQQFTYLVILLIVLAGSMISSKKIHITEILKYFVIWSIIGIFAIILYSYRFEFSNLKNRFLGEISPTTARINDSGELIINLTQDGHFYLDLIVNDSPMRFMIDTGASDLVIGLPEAKKLGIDINNLNFNKIYQTANGKSYGANITLEKISIKNINFYNIPASVNKSPMGTPLLGMSFLRKFKKYEFYQDKLVLTIN